MKISFIRFVYQKLIKPALFLSDPETVHNLLLKIGNALGKTTPTRILTKWLFHFQNPSLKQEINGLTFPNPVGLAAGFDKDAYLTDILDTVGFGFMQVGTVTNHPYKGNPKPRLFRLPKSKGIVVYFGLKNIGANKIINKLKQSQTPHFIKSISIGYTNNKVNAKTKSAIEDYFLCLKKVIEADVGDFYTINISCPNTFGGEPFYTPTKIDQLLKKLYTLNIKKPLYLKMPINLKRTEFDNLLKVIIKYPVSGVVIGNLNKDRSDPTIIDSIPQEIKGSISGLPTKKLSNQLISKTYQKYGDKLTIIGVGGIFSAQDAYEKIKRGASLVQLITGMIYEGPQLIGDINRGLVKLLEKDGYDNINQAIGKYHN